MANSSFPHIEDLLKRPDIKKPIEEFILPASTDVPPLPPSNVSLTAPISTIAASAMLQSLTDEANNVQGLIDLVTSTADNIEITVPSTEATFIGPTITTQQYMQALQTTPSDPNAHRVRSAFEYGLLTSSNTSESWPLLALRDMFDIRDTLLHMSSVMAGSVLSSTNLTSGQDWAQSAVKSHMSDVQNAAIQNSIRFRSKFLHTTLTLSTDLQGQFIEDLLNPILAAPEKELRDKFLQLRSLLITVRQAMAFSLYLRKDEFLQTRDALEQVVESALIRSALQTLVILLSKAVDKIASPVISYFEHGVNGSTPLQHLEDRVSKQVAGVLSESVGGLVSHYKRISADIIRGQKLKSDMAIKKLQVLGEHNQVSRWMKHIDHAITEIDRALATVNPTRVIANQVVTAIHKGLGPSTATLPQKIQQLPGIGNLQDVPFVHRSSTVA